MIRATNPGHVHAAADMVCHSDSFEKEVTCIGQVANYVPYFARLFIAAKGPATLYNTISLM